MIRGAASRKQESLKLFSVVSSSLYFSNRTHISYSQISVRCDNKAHIVHKIKISQIAHFISDFSLELSKCTFVTNCLVCE